MDRRFPGEVPSWARVNSFRRRARSVLVQGPSISLDRVRRMNKDLDLDLTVIIACRDDDERVGHCVRRVAEHLRHLGLRNEILAVDEGSADNTLPLLALLKREIPTLSILAGTPSGRAFVRGVALARGRAVLLIDARSEAPLSAVGHALRRIGRGQDAVAIAGRYLVLHRTRTLRAHGSLAHRRDAADLERRFLRRAASLRLVVGIAATRRRAPSVWERLRTTLLAPIASRF